MVQMWGATGDEDRQAKAKELCEKFIHLELMGAVELTSTVAESGLVAKSRVLEVCAAQAVQAEEARERGEFPAPPAKRRKGSCITVEGALPNEVNGVYYEYEHYGDALTFVKPVSGPRVFCIFKYYDNDHRWFMSRTKPNPNKPRTCAAEDLYRSKSRASSSELPSVWEPCRRTEYSIPKTRLFVNGFSPK